ncbi:MAG TPA: hypothetical protein VHV31_03085, partial [Nitrolancea sp.]|nr:hypothetical protein [Nitrolancea sp.]
MSLFNLKETQVDKHGTPASHPLIATRTRRVWLTLIRQARNVRCAGLRDGAQRCARMLWRLYKAERWSDAKHRQSLEYTTPVAVGINVFDLSSLTMRAKLYRRMIAHLRATLPQEGCGLIACDDAGAVKIYPGTNTAASETRYNMDLTEVVAA